MQTLIDYGISIVIALQSMGDWIIPIMRFFSQLGSEDFFFLVLPLIYWSIDSALGIRVAIILIFSNYLSFLGKIAFAGPRPYWVSSHVRPLWAETTFGVPSGHALNAMSIWGIIAAKYKRVWLTVLCGFIIFMIGFSRIVLGAHFPHDVILGWLIGALLLWLVVSKWDATVQWLGGKTFQQQILYSFISALVLIIIGLVVAGFRAGYELPETWLTNALRSGVEPVPVDRNDIFTTAGTFFGLCLGMAWIQARGGFQAQGPAWKRVFRFVIGLIGVFIFWQVLGAVFPRGEGTLVFSLRFLRYTLVGWWISGGAPWVFQHFNLTTA